MDEEADRKKRTRRLVWLLVLLLVALGVIAFFLLRAVGVFDGNVTVPNVVGQTQTVATQTLQNDHLAVGTVTRQTSIAANGTVLSTSPRNGTSVSRNSKVNLVVSAGAQVPTVTVPSVKGQQLTPALQEITAAGLTYKLTYVTSNQPTGTVLDQSPAGGAHVKATQKVLLTVSGTQNETTVPSVVGQSPDTAGDALGPGRAERGRHLERLSHPGFERPGGGPEPRRGATVQPNTSVNLVVSNCVSVPGVVGQPAGAAQSAIGGQGLMAATTVDQSCAGGASPGSVDAQNPGAGTQVAPGSTVTLAVCQPAATTTTSTTPPTSTSSTTTTPGGHGQAGGQGAAPG